MTSRASSQQEVIRDLAKVLAREKEEIQSPGLTCRGTRHSGNWKDRTGFERESSSLEIEIWESPGRAVRRENENGDGTHCLREDGGDRAGQKD